MRNGGAEDSMEATGAAEDIKESGREAPGLGLGLRGATLHSICPFLNMATMKDTVAVLNISLCH